MRKTFLYLAILNVVIPFTAISSFAQTAVSKPDPMTYAKSLHSTMPGSERYISKGKIVNSEEYFSHNYGSETAIPSQIVEELTAKYGPPKTGRGDLKVWEVKDSKNRNVTIMMGSNKAGQQEYIIDKRRPSRRTHARSISSSRTTIPKLSAAANKHTRSKTSINDRD